MLRTSLALLALLLICAPFAAGAQVVAATHDGGEDCSPSEIVNGNCHPVCYDHVCPEGKAAVWYS